VFGGIVLSLAVEGGVSTVASSSAPQRLSGQQLYSIPAKAALAVIANDGQPPSNIVNALVVPEGSSVASHENIDQNAGPFDRSITLSVPDPPSQVLSFYEAEMAHNHWAEIGKTLNGTAGGTSDQLFYQLAGDDTYYWQVSLTLTASVPTLTPALGGGDQTQPGTTVVMEVDQAQDDD
jgi:hypothetical protein